MDTTLNATPLKKSIAVLPWRSCANGNTGKSEKAICSTAFSTHSPEMTIHEDITACLSSAKKSLPRGGDLTEMLTHIVSHLLRHYDKDRKYYRILIQNMLFIQKNEYSPLVKLQQEQIGFVAYIIELSKMKKKISSDMNARQIATTIYHIYIGLLVNFINDPDMTVDEAAHIFSSSISLLHQGIGRRSEEKTGCPRNF